MIRCLPRCCCGLWGREVQVQIQKNETSRLQLVSYRRRFTFRADESSAMPRRAQIFAACHSFSINRSQPQALLSLPPTLLCSTGLPQHAGDLVDAPSNGALATTPSHSSRRPAHSVRGAGSKRSLTFAAVAAASSPCEPPPCRPPCCPHPQADAWAPRPAGPYRGALACP
jgi:hypothetical protein